MTEKEAMQARNAAAAAVGIVLSERPTDSYRTRSPWCEAQTPQVRHPAVIAAQKRICIVLRSNLPAALRTLHAPVANEQQPATTLMIAAIIGYTMQVVVITGTRSACCIVPHFQAQINNNMQAAITLMNQLCTL
jgi:hypothetical protein